MTTTDVIEHKVSIKPRIGCVADIHLHNHRMFGGVVRAGLNERFFMGLTALSSAVCRAINRGCTDFVVLGDLFDTTKPTPQMIAATRRVFQKAKPMRVWLIAGNHDKSTEEPTDNSLAPFEDLCTVVDDVPHLLNGDYLLAPYRSGPASVWMEEYKKIAQRTGRQTIIFTHVGLIDQKTPPWLQAATDAIEVKGFGAEVIAGNWHEHAMFALHVQQCGALVPTGFDNPLTNARKDPYGSLLIVATGVGPNARHVIPGPRFSVHDFISHRKLAAHYADAITYAPKNIYHVKLRADLSQVAEAQDSLAELMKSGIIRAGLVEPCAQDKDRVANATRKAVLNSITLDEAVVNYLDKQELPDGVVKPRVAEMVRSYVVAASKHA